MKIFRIKFVLLITIFFTVVIHHHIVGDESKEEVNIVKFSDSVYRITFPYRLRTNIGLSAGMDGILMVDTGFEETVPQLKKVLRKIGKGKLIYIINTHPHWDHTRGNVIAGPKTRIIGLQDVRQLVSEGILVKAKDPLVGKTGKRFDLYYTLDFNGEKIRFIPSPGAHSSSDMIIYFTKSGVVHMGDLLLSQSFPAVGRNIKKYLPILEKVIDIFPEDTIFLSGHGKDLTKKGVRDYYSMLLTTINLVKKAKMAGKTIKEIQRQRILKDYESYNTYLDWLTTDYWIDAVYKCYTED
jgi:glyoxylase-like metal-dependent hydrolase (beta-lactamase superfamily II)